MGSTALVCYSIGSGSTFVLHTNNSIVHETLSGGSTLTYRLISPSVTHTVHCTSISMELLSLSGRLLDGPCRGHKSRTPLPHTSLRFPCPAFPAFFMPSQSKCSSAEYYSFNPDSSISSFNSIITVSMKSKALVRFVALLPPFVLPVSSISIRSILGCTEPYRVMALLVTPGTSHTHRNVPVCSYTVIIVQY